MIIPFFFLGHWYSALLTQTLFQHRYAAHRMFRLSWLGERILFLLAYICQGSSFLNPRAYAILHRLHHEHSDSPGDPHSPVQQPNFFKMMWATRQQYRSILMNRKSVPAALAADVPRWRALERFGAHPVSRIAWGAAYTAVYFFFAPAWYWYLLLPVHFLMGPVHGAIVNWAGHKIGYRNFTSDDNSRNTLGFDFLTLGELFQNNHHKFPGRANFAKRWWEVDPGYWVLHLFDKLGLVRLRSRRQKHSPAGRKRLQGGM